MLEPDAPFDRLGDAPPEQELERASGAEDRKNDRKADWRAQIGDQRSRCCINCQARRAAL